jgi:hypothetical protein
MRRWMTWVLVSLACGVPLGYTFFYAVLPNVSFPVTDRAPMYLPAIVALALGLAVGLVVEGMDGVIVTTLGALSAGCGFASLLVLAPLTAPGIDGTFAGDVVLNVLRMASPVILASFVCLVVGGFFGQYLSDDSRPDNDIFSGEGPR